MTGAEVLIDCLKKHAVNVIFGIPGTQLNDIYAALYKNKKKIKHITARHEGCASLMAVGYTRTTNKPGICLSIPGPGASNAYTGILEAYTACDPILLIIAQEDYHSTGKDPSKLQHGFDYQSAYYPVTKYIERVSTVEKIPQAVDKAFESFQSGRPGPILLEVTCEALAANTDIQVPPKNSNFVKKTASKEELEQVINILNQSHRPFILAGRSVYQSNASKELLEFSKLLNAPIATSSLGKGVISEDESLAVGYIKTQTAKKAFADSDIIIAIGTRFVQTDTDNWTLKFSQPLIQIDTDPEEINKEYAADIGISGDIKLILRQLIKILQKNSNKNNWDSRLEYLEKLRSSRKRISYLEQIRQVLASDAIFCVDVHWLGYTACKGFDVYSPNTFLHSPISMTLGFALPAAIGAKLAFPERQVVVFCGDGGFLLSCAEFATIIKYNLNIVIIIANDNAYGTIKDIQQNQFGKTIGVDLSNPDFIKFAEAYGVQGLRVKNLDYLKPTLQKALLLNKPVIIEVLLKNSMQGKVYNAIKKAGKYLWSMTQENGSVKNE